MSSLTKLKKAESFHDFARVIGFKPKSLSYILYKIPPNKKYYSFEITKKSGGKRLIQAPAPKELKSLQRILADCLYRCCNELEKAEKRNSLAHGFKKNHSIHTNANMHKHKRYILSFDIKNFFPSINFGRVRGYFIKNKGFKLNEKIATIIAQIACHENQLPQGSPCSPIISNLVAHLLDVPLVQLARQYGLTYSRYADDITFSTNQKDFPVEIAIQDSNKQEIWEISETVKQIVSYSGFEINSKKTRMRYKNFRQTVTGLVVNKKINVRKEYYKKARAMTYSLFKKGEYTIPSTISPFDILLCPTSPKPEKSINRLEGILNYIYYTKNWLDMRREECIKKIKPKTKKDKKRLEKEKKEIQKKIENTAIGRLLKDFLFYKNFIISDKPVIICEGSTDSIYIKWALKKLFQEYPSLIKKTENKDKDVFDYLIRFFGMESKRRRKNNSRNTLTKNILKLSNGTGFFPHFINTYEENLKKYTSCSIPKHPVIILIDNDKGAKIYKDINKEIKDKINFELKTEKSTDKSTDFNNTKKDCHNSSPFIQSKINFFHICHNLYLIKTPHTDEKPETCIEDLFDQKKLYETKWNGKIFSPENNADISKYYGKIILATKVMPQKFSSDDLKEFPSLLNRFVKVIENYNQKINPPT